MERGEWEEGEGQMEGEKAKQGGKRENREGGREKQRKISELHTFTLYVPKSNINKRLINQAQPLMGI